MKYLNKRLNLLMLSSLIALAASAQKITTQHEMVDCGQIIFRKPVTAEFQMKNDGNRTLIINKVLKSCGCTSVEYPKKSIAAGESFMIKVTYDAKQMGSFVKQLVIYSNASEKPMMLSMRGRVVSQISDFSGSYDYMLGNLKADVTEIEFDDVNNGDRPVQRIHVFNPTDQVVEPVVMHLPSYLTAQVSPSKLAPHHAGEISIILDSKKLHDFGLNQTSIYVGERPGDTVSSDKEVTASAVLLPGFNKMTAEQREEAPKIQLSTTVLDLGSFNGKKKIKGEILITNTGKSTLDIRRMQMFNIGLQVSLNKSKIKVGETAKMKITAIAADLKKARTKKPRILMITNDPDMPKVVVRVNVNE